MATYPPPPQTSAPVATGSATGPRASFGRRLGALLLDGLVLAVVEIPLVIIGAVIGGGAIALVYLFIPIFIAYEIYFHGSPAGQTPGKKWLGIRVVDFATGGPIGYGRSTLRMIGRYISGIPCYLGYFWMLWDKEKQCWHDKMANDVVVPTEYYPVQQTMG
jgi:uncharacterized RDD family membrane protein YckC